MTEAITVNLGAENGTHSFRSYDHLLSWLTKERNRWSWMESARDPGDSRGRQFNRFNQIELQINNFRNEGRPFEVWKDNLPGWFHPNPEGVILSESAIGQRVQAIHDAYGPDAGAIAHSALRGWLEFSRITNLDQLRAVMVAASPLLLGPDTMAERLEKERNNTRYLLRQMIAEGARAEANRASVLQEALKHARHRTVSWTRKLSGVWDRQRRSAREAHEIAVNAINETKAAYDEFMHLKAPADYWSKKAARHQTAEDHARTRLYMFFPTALFILGLAFTITAIILLRPGPSHPTPVYFVVSAGLATFAGVVFWIGRLLTRLYLSEHHLRKDAEEREVMTTTYLALTRDQAAEEKDRHIILSALFRNSADGIVKDDGSADPGLVNALARLGMSGR
tara:strand:+ start:172 stop:1356 length:1185 start_codon:yes stop_codon:yes gene_type:complete